MKEISIKVNGMMCGGCENRIKSAVEEIAGVEHVEASHETGIVKVTVNNDIEIKTIEDTINDIGFEVVK